MLHNVFAPLRPRGPGDAKFPQRENFALFLRSLAKVDKTVSDCFVYFSTVPARVKEAPGPLGLSGAEGI